MHRETCEYIKQSPNVNILAQTPLLYSYLEGNIFLSSSPLAKINNHQPYKVGISHMGGDYFQQTS